MQKNLDAVWNSLIKAEQYVDDIADENAQLTLYHLLDAVRNLAREVEDKNDH